MIRTGRPAAGLFLGGVLLLAPAVYPQEPGAVGPEPPPALQTNPSAEGLAAKIKEIEAAKDLDDKVKAQAIEGYRQTGALLEEARRSAAAAAAHAAALTDAAPRARKLREDLKKLTAEPAPSPGASLADASLKELEAELAKGQAELALHQKKLQALDAQLEAEGKRPAAAVKELAAAREALEKTEKELAAEPAADHQARLVEAAHHALLGARRQALAARIDMLEKETLSYDARLDLTAAERDTTARLVDVAAGGVREVQDLINRRRREEAEAAQLEAERAERDAAGKHPVVTALAKENAALTRELAELAPLIERTAELLDGARKRLQELGEIFGSARQKIEIGGLSEALGQMLREERMSLPDPRRFRHGSAERKAKITEAGLSQFRREEERRELADLDRAREQLLAGRLEPGISAERRAETEAEVTKLLTDQREILGRLVQEYSRYRADLLALDVVRRQVVDRGEVYATFLDERLLWIPSTAAIGAGTLPGLANAAAWFLEPRSWREVGAALLDDALSAPVTATLASLAFLALLLSRRLLRRQLDALHARAGKVHGDAFSLTLRALLLTALLAALWPLPLAHASWRIAASPPASEFARGVGAALAWPAGLLFLMQYLRILCLPGGVAERHFRWRPQAAALLRRHLTWLLPIVLPGAFITRFTEISGTEAHQQTFGWAAFTVAMGALGIFTALLLHPRGDIVAPVLAARPGGWPARLRWLWYPSAAGLPWLLAVLGAAGYYYTALRLERRLQATAWLIVAAVLAHDLVIRWLLLAGNKLALQQAREKRAAALQAVAEKGAAGAAEEAPPVEDETADVNTLSDQARYLLRTVVTLTTAVCIWLVWASVLPALAFFDVVLWEQTVMTTGGLTHEPITLGTIAIAAVAAVLTAIAARNFPALLEIALLHRLPLDPGSRYAITTLSRYAIVALGIVIVADLVGIGWSRVQWLVAALGVGLGFGLQEIFANFVSGLIILFERPIRVGDTVTVGDVSGTVSRIRIRATTIIDWDRKELIVPNKAFITDRLVNWTLSDTITRLIVKVGIAYGSDTSLAQRLMLEVARSNPLVLEEPEPRVVLVAFGDSALNFELRVFVAQGSNTARTDILHDLHLAIDETFRRHGISIPFPQRDLHLRSGGALPGSGEDGGGAADQRSPDTAFHEGPPAV